jgi:hypothetical protein
LTHDVAPLTVLFEHAQCSHEKISEPLSFGIWALKALAAKTNVPGLIIFLGYSDLLKYSIGTSKH